MLAPCFGGSPALQRTCARLKHADILRANRRSEQQGMASAHMGSSQRGLLAWRGRPAFVSAPYSLQPQMLKPSVFLAFTGRRELKAQVKHIF